MEDAVTSNFRSCPYRHLRIDKVAMSECSICGNVCALMDGIDGLHLSVFQKKFHQKFAVFAIIYSNKCLCFFADQL